jgi:hypothetical protein
MTTLLFNAASSATVVSAWTIHQYFAAGIVTVLLDTRTCPAQQITAAAPTFVVTSGYSSGLLTLSEVFQRISQVFDVVWAAFDRCCFLQDLGSWLLVSYQCSAYSDQRLRRTVSGLMARR